MYKRFISTTLLFGVLSGLACSSVSGIEKGFKNGKDKKDEVIVVSGSEDQEKSKKRGGIDSDSLIKGAALAAMGSLAGGIAGYQWNKNSNTGEKDRGSEYEQKLQEALKSKEEVYKRDLAEQKSNYEKMLKTKEEDHKKDLDPEKRSPVIFRKKSNYEEMLKIIEKAKQKIKLEDMKTFFDQEPENKKDEYERNLKKNKEDLENCERNLKINKEDLEKNKEDLKKNKEDLEKYKDDLEKYKKDLEKNKEDLVKYKKDLENCERKLKNQEYSLVRLFDAFIYYARYAAPWLIPELRLLISDPAKLLEPDEYGKFSAGQLTAILLALFTLWSRFYFLRNLLRSNEGAGKEQEYWLWKRAYFALSNFPILSRLIGLPRMIQRVIKGEDGGNLAGNPWTPRGRCSAYPRAWFEFGYGSHIAVDVGKKKAIVVGNYGEGDGEEEIHNLKVENVVEQGDLVFVDGNSFKAKMKKLGNKIKCVVSAVASAVSSAVSHYVIGWHNDGNYDPLLDPLLKVFRRKNIAQGGAQGAQDDAQQGAQANQ